MKRNDIFIILGLIIYFITKVIDWLFFDFIPFAEIIIYSLCIVLLLLGFILDKNIFNFIKKLSFLQKVLYILLIIINIVILGYIDIVSNIILILLYFSLNYILIRSIYKFVK